MSLWYIDYLELQELKEDLSELPYLPEDRSFKKDSAVSSFSGSFLNPGRWALVSGRGLRSQHHTQTNFVTIVSLTYTFKGPYLS